MTLLAPPTSRRNLLAGAGALAGATLIGGRSVMAQSRASSIIFTGGPILTIDDAMPTAEAVAVRNGVIVAVGSLDAARAAVGRNAQVVNLDGRTLLPGFFDPHGHVSMVGLQARYGQSAARARRPRRRHPGPATHHPRLDERPRPAGPRHPTGHRLRL